MLANAFMKIHQVYISIYGIFIWLLSTKHLSKSFWTIKNILFLKPEEAVKIYQDVEKIAPEDTLAKKIGQALVKAHEYHKASGFYWFTEDIYFENS